VGAMSSSDTDLPRRDRWARLRFAIIGPLLAARKRSPRGVFILIASARMQLSAADYGYFPTKVPKVSLYFYQTPMTIGSLAIRQLPKRTLV
jgi:hypothetical protein